MTTGEKKMRLNIWWLEVWGIGIIEKNGKEEVEEYFPKLKNMSASKFMKTNKQTNPQCGTWGWNSRMLETKKFPRTVGHVKKIKN